MEKSNINLNTLYGDFKFRVRKISVDLAREIQRRNPLHPYFQGIHPKNFTDGTDVFVLARGKARGALSELATPDSKDTPAADVPTEKPTEALPVPQPPPAAPEK